MKNKTQELINNAYDNIGLWSDNNKEAKIILKPDLGLRNWDKLTKEEKNKIWEHLRPLWDKEQNVNPKRIIFSVKLLNEDNRLHSYAPNYLIYRTHDSAYIDFKDIILKENQHVVYELLSYYLKHLLVERRERSFEIYQKGDETDEDFEIRFTEWLYHLYDYVIYFINDVFEQFSINVCATRQGLIPRQDPKLMDEIFTPVLKVISLQKWEAVNRELKDAFSDLLKNNEKSYSSSVTHAISALEAFLQILNNSSIGKGKWHDLIIKAVKNGLIPNDIFTDTIFKNIEAIIARMRQEMSDAHPKQKYATEKNARLIINLIMVFIQHCLQP